MNRREFLKSFLGVAATAVLPVTAWLVDKARVTQESLTDMISRTLRRNQAQMVENITQSNPLLERLMRK